METEPYDCLIIGKRLKGLQENCIEGRRLACRAWWNRDWHYSDNGRCK